MCRYFYQYFGIYISIDIDRDDLVLSIVQV